MQQLASDVGGLQRVLTNVKTRGGWGEVQLGALLEQVLTPEQFARNVKTREGSGENGRVRDQAARRRKRRAGLAADRREISDRGLSPFDRGAGERPISVATEEAMKNLEAQLRKSAKDICTKYINPPQTTNFALMFLPTEGLYAEAIRRLGLVEQVQRECKVIFAGPTTLAALLNSLQMGFRTLAIQKSSSEVWSLLATVQTRVRKIRRPARGREKEAGTGLEPDR